MLQSISQLLRRLVALPEREDVQSVLCNSNRGVLITGVSCVVYALSGSFRNNITFFSAWLGISLLFCSFIYFRSKHASTRQVTYVSRRGARRLVAYSILLALPWSSLAIFEIGINPDGNLVLTYVVCAGMSAGGTFMLYRALAASVAYYAAILGAVIVATIIRFGFDAVPVVVYSFVYFGSLTYFGFAAGETARQRDVSLTALSKAMNEIKAAHSEIYQLAYVDTVTGLANRKSFIDRLKQAADCHARSGKPFALLLLDLDRFKNVNDTFGHSVGDKLLKLVGDRLRSFVGSNGIVARLGGDEFALLFPEMSDPDCIMKNALRLTEQLALPANLCDRIIHNSVSIGVAICPDHGTSPEQLMLNADLALNRIKDTERGRCLIFNEPLRDRVLRHDWIEQQMRLAIQNRDIRVFYQPQVALRGAQLVGAEALVRWTHPKGGTISPETFLHVASERGLLTTLSAYIADCIKSDILGWRDAGIAYPRIAMNIHPVDFRSPQSLLDTVDRLEQSGITSRDLVFEVTEGCFIGRGTDGVQFILDTLVERGFEISLDDFGTGHASLSHLKNLPVAELKIDRSFVRNIAESPKDKSIVAATVEIARGMGIRSVAEGVETDAQRDILTKMGIDAG